MKSRTQANDCKGPARVADPARPRGSGTASILLALALLAVVGLRGQAVNQAAGFVRLRDELGFRMPDAAGLVLIQVEASESADPEAPRYFPDPEKPAIADKTIIDVSGLSEGVSSHATTVATFAASTGSSFAPGISRIEVHWTDAWIQFVLRPFTSNVPAAAGSRLQNHSWAGSSTPLPETVQELVQREIVRRFDFQLDRDEVLAVVGLRNSGQPTPLLAASYHALTVGVGDGSHGSGTIAFDGPARTRPDLVVLEADLTSWAVPRVLAAGALLIDWIRQHPELTAADRIETLRAILLAGTRREALAGWSRTETSPLDPVFGAGALNLLDSFRLLDSGSREPVPPASALRHPHSGWSSASLAPGETHLYPLASSPAIGLEDFRAALTWNRTLGVPPDASLWENPQPSLPNLDLTLRRLGEDGTPGEILSESRSEGSNTEFLAGTDISGALVLEITNSGSEAADYGLAWTARPVPWDRRAFAAFYSGGDPAVEAALADPAGDYDKDGIVHELERLFGLNPLTKERHGLFTAKLNRSGPHWVLEYTALAGASVTFLTETSPVPSGWSPLTGGSLRRFPEGILERVVQEVPVVPGETRRFFRLRTAPEKLEAPGDS